MMPQDDISVDGWFEKFSETQTTVWFLEFPQAKRDAQWVGHTVFPSLRMAVKSVSEDLGNHFGYDLLLHETDQDTRISQRELSALVAEYQRQPKP